jgi:hypothetical protein
MFYKRISFSSVVGITNCTYLPFNGPEILARLCSYFFTILILFKLFFLKKNYTENEELNKHPTPF